VKYQGIRPAPGYPSQPDHTEKVRRRRSGVMACVTAARCGSAATRRRVRMTAARRGGAE
jgi:hypothetical protein